MHMIISRLWVWTFSLGIRLRLQLCLDKMKRHFIEVGAQPFVSPLASLSCSWVGTNSLHHYIFFFTLGLIISVEGFHSCFEVTSRSDESTQLFANRNYPHNYLSISVNATTYNAGIYSLKFAYHHNEMMQTIAVKVMSFLTPYRCVSQRPQFIDSRLSHHTQLLLQLL